MQCMQRRTQAQNLAPAQAQNLTLARSGDLTYFRPRVKDRKSIRAIKIFG